MSGHTKWAAVKHQPLDAELVERYRRAAERHNEGLSLFRELGDKHGIARSLSNLGAVAQNRGDLQTATELYEQSLVLRDELGRANLIVLLTGDFNNRPKIAA